MLAGFEGHLDTRARNDLDLAYDYLLVRSPAAAADTEDRLLNAAARLGGFPNRGRRGRVIGTREFVVARTPYLIVYRIMDGGVQVLRLMHGSQLWPTVL